MAVSLPILKALLVAVGCTCTAFAADDHIKVSTTKKGLRGGDNRETPCGLSLPIPVAVEPGRHSRRGASVEQPRWLKLPEAEVPEEPEVVNEAPCTQQVVAVSPSPVPVVTLSPSPVPVVALSPAAPAAPMPAPMPASVPAPAPVPASEPVPTLEPLPAPAPPPMAVHMVSPASAPIAALPLEPIPVIQPAMPLTQCPPACPEIKITMNLPPWPAPPMPMQPAVQAPAHAPAPATMTSPGPAVTATLNPSSGGPTFQSSEITSVSVPVTVNQPATPTGAAPPAPPVVQEAATAKALKKRGEKLAKNMTAELLQEYNSLHKEVHEVWESWQGLAGSLGPKMEYLQQASNSLRAVVSSVHDLHIPDVRSLCSKLTSCDACAASSICGWCTSSLVCVPGTPDGILEPGACGTGVGSDGAYSFSSCPGMGCDAYLSCAECTQQASCGWCGAASGTGHCLQGSEWGPMGAAPGGPNEALAVTCPAQGPDWIHRNGKQSQC